MLVLKTAKWSYSGGYSTEADVVKIEETKDGRIFIHAKRELRGEILEYKLTPDRLDNWEEIRENEISDQSRNEVDLFMDIPSYSVNDGGTWKALKGPDEVLSEHGTHTDLKEEYNARCATSTDKDFADYELLYNPNDVR